MASIRSGTGGQTMRLIDVNKLNECLFIHKGKICPNRDIDNFPITMTVEDVKSAISKQPTAYDVDKVINQIEKDKFIDCETILSDVHQGYNAGLSRAIEIVKAGGRDER